MCNVLVRSHHRLMVNTNHTYIYFFYHHHYCCHHHHIWNPHLFAHKKSFCYRMCIFSDDDPRHRPWSMQFVEFTILFVLCISPLNILTPLLYVAVSFFRELFLTLTFVQKPRYGNFLGVCFHLVGHEQSQ